MLYCKKCGAAMPPYSKFCSNCGQSFAATQEISSAQLQSTAQQNKKVNGLLTTGIACGISTVLVAGFLIFVFAFGSDSQGQRRRISFKPKEEEIVQNMQFTAGTYEVKTKQEMDMSQYLQCEGLSAEQVVWSTDSAELVVGSKGHITLNEYNTSCQLTATSKTDERVSATCMIVSTSEENEFIYQVETLNGKHNGDENAENGVVKLAYASKDEQIIDTYAEIRAPGARKSSYKWNAKLFYSLEEISADSYKDGLINSYRVAKKKFISKDSGNEIEYEIYHHPDTDKINKIVSIEDKGKKLSIVEYYFTDNEKVNFIFAYKDVNYTPSYATPNRTGERYLFKGDTLVTWRTVENNRIMNYSYAKAERTRLLKSWYTKRNVKAYSKLSDKKKKKYDMAEKKMLNAAYNTLNKIKNYEGVSIISGYLNEASGKGLESASVTLESVDYDCPVYTASTNQDGYYEIMVPTKDMSYELAFSKDTYLSETLYEVEADTAEINLSQEVVYLSEEDENEYPCTLTFYDALNKNLNGEGMAPLDDLYIIIRRGVNNRTGTPIYEGHVSGEMEEVILTPGMYTVEFSKDTYMNAYSSLFVSKDTGNTLALYATPELKEDEYRIVLTWDEYPADLDSHLFAPISGSNSDDFHICYYYMSDASGNTSLDVDDTSGYGPETTTIKQIKRGQYKFYVCDYTNCSRNDEESYEMSNSSATVRVYGSQGLINTFYVPVHRKGVIWEVFEIRDGTVIPTQRYYDSIGNKTWWNSNKWQ